MTASGSGSGAGPQSDPHARPTGGAAAPAAASAAGDGGVQRPAGFRRVAQALHALGHPEPPRWLDVPARTSQEAADALGVQVGQIAKCVVFRRRADDRAVLVVAPGDRRVDETAVAAQAGPLARADAAFVKASTGYAIGGVSPLAHGGDVQVLIDASLWRFDAIWAAAGHPNGVFRITPAALAAATGAPVLALSGAGAPVAVASAPATAGAGAGGR